MADDIKFNVQVDLKGREAFATASNEIKALSQQAQTASASVGVAPGGLGAGFIAAGASAVVLAAGIAVAGAAFYGIVSAASAAVIAAASYEAKLAQIQALTPTTAGEIDKIRIALLGMAGQVGKAPNELAEGMYFLASSGITGARALEAVELAGKASAIGMGSMKDITMTLAAVLNSYSGTGLTAAHAMDVFTQTVIQGGAEASGLASSLGRVTGIAAAAGIEFEEVGAYIATFTRSIPSAAEAVTSLRQLIMNLEAPSSRTKSALAELGISTEDLNKSIRERGLMVTLQELFALTGGNVDKLHDLIPNVRALAGAMGTMGTQAGTYKTVLDAMYNSTGQLNTSFKIVQATLSWQWSSVTASWQAMKIAIGEGLTPAVSLLASAVLPILVNMMRGVGLVFMENRALFTDIASKVLPLLLTVLGGVLAAIGFLLSGGSWLTRVFAEQVVNIWAAVAAWRALKGDMTGAAQATSEWHTARAVVAGLDQGVQAVAEQMKIAGINAGLAAKGIKGIGMDSKTTSDEQKRWDQIMKDVYRTMAGGNVVTEEASKKQAKLNKLMVKAQDAFIAFQRTQGSGVSGSAAHAQALGARGLIGGGTGLIAPTAREEIDNQMRAIADLAAVEEHLREVEASIARDRERTRVAVQENIRQTDAARRMTLDWAGALRSTGEAVIALGLKAGSTGAVIVQSIVGGVQGFMSYATAVREAAAEQEKWDSSGANFAGSVSPLAEAITNTQRLTAAVGALSAAMSIYANSQGNANTASRVLQGAMTGAAAGAAFGGYGALAGALLGGAMAWSQGPQWPALGESLGRTTGHAVSQSLLETMIAEVDAGLSGYYNVMGLHLAELWRQSGGIMQLQTGGPEGETPMQRDIASLSIAWSEMRNLLADIEAGRVDFALGQKAFNDAMEMMLPVAVSATSGLLSEQIGVMIAHARATGVASAAVDAFLDAQRKAGTAAFNNMGGLVVTEASSGGIGASIAAQMESLRASGMTIAQALAELQPAIDAFAEKFAELGVTGGDAFASIAAMANLAADEVAGPMIAGINAAGDALRSLHNQGILTEEMFTGLSSGIADTYASLVEQGYGGSTALAMIAPDLQTIWELQQRYGYEVDATTQALLDEALAANIVGEAHRSAQDRMADGIEQLNETLGAMATAFGVTLPAGIELARQKWELFNQTASQTPGTPKPPAPPPGDGGDNSPAPGMASGGFVPETWPSGRTIRVAEPGTGGEFMVPANKTHGGSSRPQVLEVTVNMQFPFGQLVSVMERAQLANAFRVRPDAVQDFS